MDRYLIKSVLGFNLKVEIKDMNGNIIPTGIKRTSFPLVYANPNTTQVIDKKFFTSFNEDLLNKIRQHRQLND